MVFLLICAAIGLDCRKDVEGESECLILVADGRLVWRLGLFVWFCVILIGKLYVLMWDWVAIALLGNWWGFWCEISLADDRDTFFFFCYIQFLWKGRQKSCILFYGYIPKILNFHYSFFFFFLFDLAIWDVMISAIHLWLLLILRNLTTCNRLWSSFFLLFIFDAYWFCSTSLACIFSFQIGDCDGSRGI